MFGAQQGMEAGFLESLLSILPVVSMDISEQRLKTDFGVLIRQSLEQFLGVSCFVDPGSPSVRILKVWARISDCSN